LRFDDIAASRIESTGARDRVQLSEQTAKLVIRHKKQSWIVRRDDMVEAKGKGKLVTYWLRLNSDDITASSTETSETSENETSDSSRSNKIIEFSDSMIGISDASVECKHQRLADWNSELLLQLLRRVVAHRSLAPSSQNLPSADLLEQAQMIGQRSTVVEQVVEIINMPDFAHSIRFNEGDLSEAATKQLRLYVERVASMYHDNPCK
jgi:Adenylate and Guanylate cyclase catalytic domain